MGEWPIRLLLAILGLILAGLTGCDRGKPPESKPPQLAKELVFYSWAEYMPQTVIDAFAKEFGVKVIYEMYDSTEAAAESLRAGKRFDVATIDNNYLAALARDGLIAALDDRNIPNFKNISPSFRDLIFDPGNRHSVPYNWGTTSLLVRADRVPGLGVGDDAQIEVQDLLQRKHRRRRGQPVVVGGDRHQYVGQVVLGSHDRQIVGRQQRWQVEVEMGVEVPPAPDHRDHQHPLPDARPVRRLDGRHGRRRCHGVSHGADTRGPDDRRRAGKGRERGQAASAAV